MSQLSLGVSRVIVSSVFILRVSCIPKMATTKPPPPGPGSVHPPSATDPSSTSGISAHYGSLTDRLYNAELSRRAVARAALHLGIDRVEGQALDCLGDALLEHLDRVSLCVRCWYRVGWCGGRTRAELQNDRHIVCCFLCKLSCCAMQLCAC